MRQFLHNHPILEKGLKLEKGLVIVNKEDLEKTIKLLKLDKKETKAFLGLNDLMEKGKEALFDELIEKHFPENLNMIPDGILLYIYEENSEYHCTIGTKSIIKANLSSGYKVIVYQPIKKYYPHK